MEVIREIQDSFDLTLEDVSDTYLFALHLLDASKRLGKIKEKRNEVLVKGPRKEVHVEYEIIDQIDKFHRVTCSVIIYAPNLRGKVDISIQTFVKVWRLDEEHKGFFSKLVNTFYKKELEPLMFKLSEERARHMKDMIIEFAKMLAKS